MVFFFLFKIQNGKWHFAFQIDIWNGFIWNSYPALYLWMHASCVPRIMGVKEIDCEKLDNNSIFISFACMIVCMQYVCMERYNTYLMWFTPCFFSSFLSHACAVRKVAGSRHHCSEVLPLNFIGGELGRMDYLTLKNHSLWKKIEQYVIILEKYSVFMKHNNDLKAWKFS